MIFVVLLNCNIEMKMSITHTEEIRTGTDKKRNIERNEHMYLFDMVQQQEKKQKEIERIVNFIE